MAVERRQRRTTNSAPTVRDLGAASAIDSRCLLGILLLDADQDALQCAVRAGSDFVFLDLEHGQISDEHLSGAVTALRGSGVMSIIRAPGQQVDDLRHFASFNPNVILVPHVSNEVQASALVAALSEIKGSELMVVIETREGVQNADAILTVEGISGAFIGHVDLTTDMGIRGDFLHPECQSAFERILSAASTSAKIIGAAVHRGRSARNLARSGVRLIVLGTNRSMGQRLAAEFARTRDLLNDSKRESNDKC